MITEQQREAFWSKVRTGAEHECWPFVGAKNRRGYGVIRVAGHRLASLVSMIIARTRWAWL